LFLPPLSEIVEGCFAIHTDTHTHIHTDTHTHTQQHRHSLTHTHTHTHNNTEWLTGWSWKVTLTHDEEGRERERGETTFPMKHSGEKGSVTRPQREKQEMAQEVEKVPWVTGQPWGRTSLR